MIIQHNIMAKKAYRGYSKGTAALKGNLEKLSSGYKINRAGDDAAGLAISEKMRAQITGLETAAKNAKDGISLVQTAEGALAEVHDMLDRMIELAGQSANGTYDDETDRDQLQKEMEQLKAEVDRIATSSNFNGMNLLDGTMDASTARGVEYVSTDAEGLEKLFVNQDWKGKTEDDVAGVDGTAKNVLETEDTLPVKGGFEINLDGTEVTIGGGETFTLKIGNLPPIKPRVTPMATGRYVSSDLAKAFDKVPVELEDAEGNKCKFTAHAEGQILKFTADDGENSFKLNTNDKVSWEVVSGEKSGDVGGKPIDPIEVDGGKKVHLQEDQLNLEGIKAAADKAKDIASGKVLIQKSGDNTVALYVGDTKISKDVEFAESFTSEAVFKDVDGNVLLSAELKELEEIDNIPEDGLDTGLTYSIAPEGEAKGTINSGLQNVVDNVKSESGQLANTVVDFKPWTDGAKFTIGSTTYTVALGENSKFKNAANVIDLTDRVVDPLKDPEDIEIAAQRLTVAAKDNKIFTVGHDGNGHTTLQQRSEAKESTDMTTKEKLISYLGVTYPHPDSMANAEVGQGLSFHIGENGDDSSKLKIDIGDMHTTTLGISEISVETQENASAAMDKIRSAVNSVSDVRGTLGATQNRLDHSINNLSVMAENVQDSESTIRDTDVAEEMMAYTKNNILIQSSQAMLAQANQVPQGVLQLMG